MTKKEYEISVRANKKSLDQLRESLTTELTSAFENVDATGKIKGLSRSDKAAIKSDLSALFGIADEQAEALRKMVQGIIPSDAKGIEHMKSQLQDTLKFATGIMEQMKLLGESTDWMKQGVTFVDKFVGMQGTLLETQKVVSGMQTSIDALTKSFQTFKEALAVTSPSAFADRFGAEIRSVTEDVKKAQSIIDGLRGKQNKGIKQALALSGDDLQDYAPKMSVEDIRGAHEDIIGEIARFNKKIQELESAHKGKMASLYSNPEYQDYIHGLAVELKNLQNLRQQPLFKDAFADAGAQVSANLKAVTEEISAAAKNAGAELRQVIESLKTDGIKLSVTLPEADSAEFVAKVNDFVNKASAQFKKAPIKINLDFANPFKSTKAIKQGTAQAKDITGIKEVFERNATETGVDVGDSLTGLNTKDTTRIVQGVVESFNKVYAAVKTGQKTITQATKLWQQEMQKYLILKAKFDKSNVEDEAVAMMNQLQTYLDENIPLHLGVDTAELIQEIQKALQEAKFKINIDAGSVNGKGTPINLSDVQFVSSAPVSRDYDDDYVHPTKSTTTVTSTSTATITKNSSAVEESTRTQRVLTDAIKSLNSGIERNINLDKIISDGKTPISRDTVKELDDKISAITARGLEIGRRKNEITRLISESNDAKLIAKLNSEFKELESEWKKLYEQHQRLEERKRSIETKLAQIENGELVDTTDAGVSSRAKQNKLSQKRATKIQSVLDSSQSPAVLLLDDINKFWDTSSKKIAKTQAEVAALNKQLEGLKEGTPEYDKTKQAIRDQERIISSWTSRQALMSQKGLDDMREVGLEDAIRALTEVLRRSPTLSDSLLNNSSLKGLSPVREIAYYSGIAQNALGFKTQTDKEYVDEQTLQAKFVELFRINDFINKINAMFPKKGAEPKVSDVEAFIKFFEKIPEMSNAVEAAKKYLVELKGVSELQAKDATFKTFKEQGAEDLYFPKRAQELWGQLDDSIRTSLSQELTTRGVDAKNFSNLEDASGTFAQIKNLYKEGAFDSIKTDNAAFGQLITLLKQSVAVDSSRQEFKAVSDSMATVFDGKLKSVLFDAINPDRPLSVRIIGSHGEESVYDIHKPGGAHLNSDRSFSTNSKSLNKFLRRSGLEDQMSQIVSSIFEDPKTAQTLIDDLFSSGKIQLATGKNAFVKKSAQSYSFGNTVLGQYLADQKRLEQELSSAKAGKYNMALSKRLEGLSTEEQTRIVNEFIANKEKELEALRQANISEREVIQSLLALEDDIDINAAKQTAARRRSNAAKKRAKRLTEEGVDSVAYKAALNSFKRDTFGNDYGLTRLMSQIDIAGQFGLMDTSELVQLAADYQEKYERAKQLPKRSQVPNERMGEIDAAWAEVEQARKRLIDQYYNTDGWYLAKVARDELTTIETEAERSRQQIQAGATSANSTIAARKAEIQAQETRSKQLADEYADGLYRKYILEPEEKAQAELSRRTSEIAAKKADIEARKSALGKQADLDKGLEALKTEIFKRQSADTELNRLMGLRSNVGIGTPEHVEYTAKIQEIEVRYAAEYNAARQAWIDGKAKELDAEYDAFIDSVKKNAGGDTTNAAIKAFNTDMKGKTTPKKSLSGIKKYIEAVKQQMYSEAEEVTRQALAGLDTSTGIPQEELDRMLRESKEAAAKKKQAIIDSIRGRTATELMSDAKGKESVGTVGKAYEAEVALGVELKKQRQALMDRFGITKEVLDAERSMTRLSEERVDVAKKEEALSSASSASSGTSKSSGGFGAGFVGALNASNLATESTLRGIYELLNGGAPKGGWSNSNTSSTSQVKGNNGGKPVSASDSDHEIKTASDKFVSSVSQLVKTLSTRTKYEGAALIGADGKLGKIISGNEHSVPASKISTALANQVKQVLAVLHNHPSGLSSLSQGDMNAAFARAYGKGVYSDNSPVKVSGSVANGILTSVNFNGIDEQVAQQIINHYNTLLSKLPEQFGEVFAFENGTLIVSDAINSDPELRAGVSNILSAVIKSAFEKFGYGDAFQQISVDNIGAWKDSIIGNAQQKVVESIVQSGANVAVEAAKEVSAAPNVDTIGATTTKEIAKYVNSISGKKDGGSKLTSALYSLAKFDITSDEYAYSSEHGEKLAKAYSQLKEGMQGTIVNQLDDNIKAYIVLLQGKLLEIAQANGLDYDAINKAVSARVESAKSITGTQLTKESAEAVKTELKALKASKVTGSKRAYSGFNDVYSVISSGKEKLTGDDLTKLGTGYYQLVKTVEHDIFNKLNEQTQQLLIEARDKALAVLEQYGVKVYGDSELSGKVITEETKRLISGQRGVKKVGAYFTNMTSPALERTITKEDGGTKTYLLQAAVGQLSVEKKISEEKGKQAKLSQEAVQQEGVATKTAKKRAEAEGQVSKNKGKSNAASSLSGNIQVPVSGNNQGGILGLLGRLATEATLQRISSLLSNGIKTTTGNNGGENSTKSSKTADVILSDREALSRLQAKIQADYPEFASIGNSRPVAGGHAIDVFQYKNLDKIKEVRAEIERLNNEGKASTEEWNAAQQRLNALLTEQEKITLRINTKTGEITTKSSFQNLAVGAKAAMKELQHVDTMMSQLQEAGTLSISASGDITSRNQTVQNYLNSLRQLQTYKDGLSPDALFDPSTQQKLSNLTLATQNYRKEVVALLDATSRLNIGEKIGAITGDIAGLSSSQITQVMQGIVAQSTGLETTFKKLTPITNEFGQVVSYQLAYSLRTGKREAQNMIAALNPLTGEIRVQQGAVESVSTSWDRFWAGFKGKFASITQYLTSMGSIYRVFSAIRQGITYVREIDSALTELKKVTDETDESYTKFLQDLSKTGGTVGATVADLTSSASDWARLGSIIKSAPLCSNA